MAPRSATQSKRGSVRAASVQSGDGGKVGAEPAAKKRKGEVAEGLGSASSKASSSACKCLKCGRLSSTTRWYEVSRQLDKRATMKEVAVGPKCFDCGDLHSRAFGHLKWEAWCQHSSDAVVSENIKEAEDSKVGQPKAFPMSSVLVGHGVALEVRSSALVLNEAELKKKLGVSRLPKNMKSIPTVLLPIAVDDDLRHARGQVEYETCYCFKDPSQPFRTAAVVQTLGARSEEPQLVEQLWARQGMSVMQQAASATLAKTEGSKIISAHKNLLDLGEFVEQRTSVKQATKKRKGGLQNNSGEQGQKLATGGNVANEDQEGDGEDSESAADASDSSTEHEGLDDSDAEAQETDDKELRPQDTHHTPKKAPTSSPGVKGGLAASSASPATPSVAGSGMDGDDSHLVGDRVGETRTPWGGTTAFEACGVCACVSVWRWWWWVGTLLNTRSGGLPRCVYIRGLGLLLSCVRLCVRCFM